MQGLAGYFLINHSGRFSNKATHWFTKDMWLSFFNPPVTGPGKRLSLQMKALWAAGKPHAGRSGPPAMVWALLWLLRLTHRTLLRLRHLLVPLCPFRLWDLHVVPYKFQILGIVPLHKPVHSPVSPTDK